MDEEQMKNMIILKDLPSNMIDTAFIVFKDNINIHKFQKVEKNKLNKNNKNKEEKHRKDYMVKEAQMIIEEYISKIEKKEYELGNGNKKLKTNYKRLKYLTIFLAMFSALSLALIMFK